MTLRGARMYEFLDRFITLAIPRIRDFRGLPNRSFDGRGNYTFGIKEQMIFPEIDYDKVEKIHGMDITLVTVARRATTWRMALLRELGWPFRGETPGRRSAQVGRVPPMSRPYVRERWQRRAWIEKSQAHAEVQGARASAAASAAAGRARCCASSASAVSVSASSPEGRNPGRAQGQLVRGTRE